MPDEYMDREAKSVAGLKYYMRGQARKTADAAMDAVEMEKKNAAAAKAPKKQAPKRGAKQSQ
jgi:hypothetical protein